MTRVVRLAPLIVAAIVLAVGLWTLSPLPTGVFEDDGMYVILGKALAQGNGLRFVNLPGAPANAHYPPGYPALLALLWLLAPGFPGNVAVFKAANVVLLAVAAALGWRLATERFELRPALAAAAVLAGTVTIPPLLLAGMTLSETLFLALLLTVLLAAEGAADRPTPRRAVVLGVLIGALTLVRTLGIALLPAAALAVGRRRAWREAGLLVLAAVLVLAPWQAWAAAHADAVSLDLRGKYGAYLPWLLVGVREHGLPFVWATARANGEQLATALRVMLAPGLPAAVKTVLACITAGVLLVGLVTLRRLVPVTLGFLVLYFAIVIAWPFAPLRFLWGVWLVLVLVFSAGAAALVRQVTREGASRAARYAVIATVLLVVAGHGLYNWRGYRGAWWGSIARQRAAAAAPLLSWVLERTDPRDVVAADAETLLYLYSGRQVIPVGDFRAEEHLVPTTEAHLTLVLGRLLRHYPVDWLLASRPELVRAAESLAAAGVVELEAADRLAEGGVAYRVRRPALARPPQRGVRTDSLRGAR